MAWTKTQLLNFWNTYINTNGAQAITGALMNEGGVEIINAMATLEDLAQYTNAVYYHFVATAGQTQFTLNEDLSDNALVLVAGKGMADSEYNGTTPSTLTFEDALKENDEVIVLNGGLFGGGGTPGTDYIDDAQFNTGTGILALTGVGNAGASVNLDGRYSTIMVPVGTSNGQTLRWDGFNWVVNDRIMDDGLAIFLGIPEAGGSFLFLDTTNKTASLVIQDDVNTNSIGIGAAVIDLNANNGTTRTNLLISATFADFGTTYPISKITEPQSIITKEFLDTYSDNYNKWIVGADGTYNDVLSGEIVEFLAGTGMTIVRSTGSGFVRYTLNADGGGEWTPITGGIYYNSGRVSIGADFLQAEDLAVNGTFRATAEARVGGLANNFFERHSNIVEKNGDYNVVEDQDRTILAYTTGTITLPTPDAGNQGQILVIKKTLSGSPTTISGAILDAAPVTSLSMAIVGECVTLQSGDSTNNGGRRWIVTSWYKPS